jgi:predicted ester cyclase
MATVVEEADFRRVWDGVWHLPGQHDATMRERYSPDFRIHISSLPDPIGREAFIGFVGGWHKAFPDGRMEILDIIHREDKLWCYWISTGTHSAEYLGIPATGKKVAYQGVDIYRFNGDKVAECWAVPDVLTLLRQLGVIPEPRPQEAGA